MQTDYTPNARQTEAGTHNEFRFRGAKLFDGNLFSGLQHSSLSNTASTSSYALGTVALGLPAPVIPAGTIREIRTELVRKSIHLLIALVPAVASIAGVGTTILILAAGTLLYTVAESVRLDGRSVAVISYVTSIAARPRDAGRFVLGPVTLGLGAMIALLLYPEPAASLAIYSLAFGDGLSSVIGKLVGRTRIPLTGGKTVAGSAACFAGVFIAAYFATRSAATSVSVAAVATVLEAFPARDLDNMILPVGVGLIANRLLVS